MYRDKCYVSCPRRSCGQQFVWEECTSLHGSSIAGTDDYIISLGGDFGINQTLVTVENFSNLNPVTLRIVTDTGTQDIEIPINGTVTTNAENVTSLAIFNNTAGAELNGKVHFRIHYSIPE
jgi:hypothetical protein